MKLRAPPGTTKFGPDLIYKVAADRSVEVPEDLAETLIESHGFAPWKEAIQPKDVRSMSHPELMLHVMEMTRRTLEALPTEELRQRLLAVSPGTVIMPDDTAKGLGINPDSVKISDIANMTRFELFAYLKAHGIIGKPTHSRDDLAKMALDVLKG